MRRFQGRLAELEGGTRYGAAGEAYTSRFRCHLAALLVELGRYAEAREEFSALAQHSFAEYRAEINSRRIIVYELALLSEVCSHLKEVEHCTSLYELLFPYVGRHVTFRSYSTLGCASRYLGLLSTVMRRYDQAEEHFQEALRVEERMSARPWQAYALADYALMRIRRDAPGDVAAARDQLDQALAIAQKIEAKGIENYVQRVTGRL